MTKQDFINYLSHPENLNGHSIAALEKLVQEYPYFQMGRMLYLKNLHNENSIEYEKNLHITSAYAPSGKILYNLIKRKAAEKIEVKVEKPEVVETIIINQPPAEIIEEPKEVLPKPEPVATLQETPIVTKEEIKEIPVIAKAEADEMHPDSYRELEKQMLREAYRTSMTIDLLGENQVSGIKAQQHIVQKADVRSQNHSFGDWMKALSGKIPGPVKENPSTKPVPSAAEGLRVTSKVKTEIIDNFILSETAKSTPKPKAEFYSAEVMAKKSLQDDENFVTETLAKIYLKQGNLPKALRSYEILVMKYPEKVHIFAPLLEKIKKLLKDQTKK